MRKSKIGSLFLISVFVLAGIGISYAGFFDDISVYGSVDTATVTITQQAYSGTWVYKIWGFTGTPPNPPAGWAFYDLTKELLIYRGFTNLTTAVTSWASTNGGHAELEAGAYAEIGTTHNSQLYDVDMVWWNIFPCIDFTADVIIHYDGSIPAHITHTDLVWNSAYYNFGSYTTFHAYSYTKDANGAWIKGAEIAFPVQMHYCEYIGIEVTIHLPQDNTLQDKNGEFSFNIHALQWNDLCVEQGNTIKVSGFDYPRNRCPLGYPTGLSALILKNALLNLNNFGPSGTVKAIIEFVPFVQTINTGSLVNAEGELLVDVFFAGLTGQTLTEAEANELEEFLYAGGILYISGNSGSAEGPSYHPLFTALGWSDVFSVNTYGDPGTYQSSIPINTLVTNGPFGIVGPLKQSIFREFLYNLATPVAYGNDGIGYTHCLLAEAQVGIGYISISGDPIYFDIFMDDSDNLNYFLNLFALAS